MVYNLNFLPSLPVGEDHRLQSRIVKCYLIWRLSHSSLLRLIVFLPLHALPNRSIGKYYPHFPQQEKNKRNRPYVPLATTKEINGSESHKVAPWTYGPEMSRLQNTIRSGCVHQFKVTLFANSVGSFSTEIARRYFVEGFNFMH